MGWRQERIAALQFAGQRRDRGNIEVAAGKRRFCRPAVAGLGAAQVGRQAFKRLLGQPSIGGDLAAIDRKQRCPSRGIELEDIVARGGLGLAGAVIIERTNAGVSPHHVRRPNRLSKVFADRIAEIRNLLGRGFHLGWIASVVAVGGANQREIFLIGNDEHDAAVAVLKYVCPVMGIELWDDDVRALHQPHFGFGIDARAACQHILDPRARGVDQRPGVDGAALATQTVFNGDSPDSVRLQDLNRTGAGADISPAIRGVARRQHHQAGVIHETV